MWQILKKTIRSKIINYRKQRRQRNYKRKSDMNWTKKRVLIREHNELNKETKQKERKQKSENILDEDTDLGIVFELATVNKNYVNGLNLHEIRNENLLDYEGDF